MTTKQVITIITGRLYCSLDDVYAAFKELTGIKAFTHELPSLMDFVRPQLLGQIPENLKNKLETWEHTVEWEQQVKEVEEEYGTEFKFQIDIR